MCTLPLTDGTSAPPSAGPWIGCQMPVKIVPGPIALKVADLRDLCAHLWVLLEICQDDWEGVEAKLVRPTVTSAVRGALACRRVRDRLEGAACFCRATRSWPNPIRDKGLC
jgi:hypothetical protein